MDFDREPNWDLRWNPEHGVLFVRAWGEMSAESSVAVLEAISAGEAWPADAPAIWDVREASFPGASGDALRALAAERARFENRRVARVAMVVDDDLNFGLMRMFEMLSDTEHGSIQVFRDLDAALRWVSGS